MYYKCQVDILKQYKKKKKKKRGGGCKISILLLFINMKMERRLENTGAEIACLRDCIKSRNVISNMKYSDLE